MLEEPTSPPNKKMKYKYDKYQNEVAPTHVDCKNLAGSNFLVMLLLNCFCVFQGFEEF